MEIIRSLTHLLTKRRACVLTIGNFDGVHLGHQAVLKQVMSVAKDAGLISTVLIFEPQPIEFFSLTKAPSRLTRLREKLDQFKKQGIDRVVCLKFNEALAALSADEFIKKIVVDALRVRILVVGHDFRFAKKKEGDFEFLYNARRRFGFDLQKTVPFQLHHQRISSTLIRQALAVGDMHQAAMMLGRFYRINGRVVHGDKRGREIGFATANIELRRYASPVAGIFSGRVYGFKEQVLDAVIYVGTRSVYAGKNMMLEVHIFDFCQDLYGCHLQVEFLEKIRSDQHFSTEEALILQIRQDMQAAKVSLEKYQ